MDEVGRWWTRGRVLDIYMRRMMSFGNGVWKQGVTKGRYELTQLQGPNKASSLEKKRQRENDYRGG